MSRGRSDRHGFEKMLYEQHVSRVRNMKGYVDTTPPRAHPLGNKAELDKRRKFAAIEFDNKLLLERLAAVVQTKTIDNEVNEMTKLHTNFKKKLSLTKKKMEMQKITEENQRILKRIQEVPPAYNHFEWEEEAKVHEKHKRGMAIYPEYYEKLDREEAMKRQGLQRTNTNFSATGGGTPGLMGSTGGRGTNKSGGDNGQSSPGFR